MGDRTYSDNNMGGEGESFNAGNGGGAGSSELRMTKPSKSAGLKGGSSAEKKTPQKDHTAQTR